MEKKYLTVFGLLTFGVMLLTLPVAADEVCSLNVLSIPAGCAVSIDGSLIGTTPLNGAGFACGNHTVTISANGYADHTEKIELKNGNPYTIVANLLRLNDRGTVLIKSDPAGGDVYVDGALKGITPLLVDALSPGPHTILIRKAGYEDYRDVIAADPGIIPEYDEALVPLPQTAFLGIVTTPDNATAYVDGSVFGTTPTILMRISYGTHTILIQKEGYKNYTQTVQLDGGSTKLVSANLEKIPDEGTLIVDSSPSGADLYLNGTYKTVTPVTYEQVPCGNYTLEFRKLNYTSQNISFTLAGGETLEVYAQMGTGDGGSVRTVTHDSTTDDNGAGSTPGSATIDRTFTWYSQGHMTTTTLHIPVSLYEYYKSQPHPRNGSDMEIYTLSDEDRAYLHDLIGQLKDASGSKSLTARNDYHNVVAFVQSISYVEDSVSTGQSDYWKYPIETLSDGNGDCEDTAILTAALLKEMNYDVAVVLLPEHAAVAVACDNCNGYYYPLNGRKYYYLETTGSGFSLGSMNFAGASDKYASVPAQVYVL